MRALDFDINRFFIKLFNANVIDAVKLCQDIFWFALPSVMIEKCRAKFLYRFKQ